MGMTSRGGTEVGFLSGRLFVRASGSHGCVGGYPGWKDKGKVAGVVKTGTRIARR